MLANAIKDLLFTRIKNLGYHLIRVKFNNHNGKKTLQIMAERINDRMMDIDDCVFLSKEISAFLEVEDLISSSYTLEVSSGGIARPLTMIEDYTLFKNSQAKIYLKEKFKGNKSYTGFLKGVDEMGIILLNTQDFDIQLKFSEIEKANLEPNWVIKNKFKNL